MTHRELQGNETPLMFAVRFQNHKSVETLLGFGIDFMLKNNVDDSSEYFLDQLNDE